jgi:hypothetical protein
MLIVPIFRKDTDAIAGVLILVNKRESFVLDDARKLEHYRSAIFPCVECICRYASASTKNCKEQRGGMCWEGGARCRSDVRTGCAVMSYDTRMFAVRLFTCYVWLADAKDSNCQTSSKQ